jgi:3-oxoacyl-[acyl-carrier protein] reductase
MRLDGRVGLVTGGGSGIGAAICRAFAKEGARIAVVDRDRKAGDAIAGEVGGTAIECDVSDSAAVDAAFARAEDALGPVDVLVNNAGIIDVELLEAVQPRMEAAMAEMLSGQSTTHLDATVNVSDAQWRRMVAVHLDGTFFCTRAALRSMAPRGRGAIVNMGSICGMEGCVGQPHYSAAKGAILAFTRSVAKEVVGQGIRVNAIAPGYIDTPMLGPIPLMLRQMLAMQTPIRRLGTPDEIAATAVFLASDEASFVVGETISPNGGYLTV